MHHRMPPEVTPQQAVGQRADAVYQSWRQQGGASGFPALRQQPLPFPQQQQQQQMGSADSFNSSMVPYEQQSSVPPMSSRGAHGNPSGFSVPPLASYSTAGLRPSHREQDAAQALHGPRADGFASPASCSWSALSTARPQNPPQPYHQHLQQHQQSTGGQVGQQQATSASSSSITTTARPAAKRSFFDKKIS